MTKRGGLGRGLAALIPTGPAPPAAPPPAPDGRRRGRAPRLRPARSAWYPLPPATAPAPAPAPRPAARPSRGRRRRARRAAARDRRRRRRPQPEAAAAGLRRRGARGAEPLHARSSGSSSRSSSGRAGSRDARYELVMGERRLRAARAAGLDDRPGDRAGHPRRRHAARRAAGEHPPGPAQPARGGRGLPAAAGGVRRHPRGAGPPDRPQPVADHQHHPPDEPAGEVQTPGRRRRPLRRARAGAARLAGRRGAGRPGHPDRRRGDVGPRHRGGGRDGRRRAARPPSAGLGRSRARGGGTRPRLSDMFETRVKVEIGRCKGKIVVEFGSVDDLQRIIGVMAPEITGRRPEA